MTMRLLPEKQDWTPYVWIIYVVPFLLGPALKARPAAGEWLLTTAVTIAFLAIYFRGYWLRGRDLYWVIASILVMGVVFLPSNLGAGAFFIYASSFASALGNTKVAVRTIVLIEVILCIEVWVMHISPITLVWSFFFTAVIGAINVHYEGVRQANHRLRMAQDEIEQLATMAERERIARDLHDLLGHTLSLIVLKSELASKLSTRDPQRAFEEIRDVERISRDALAEVRQAVSGYRGGWRSELEAAADMLRVASINVETKLEKLTLSPAQEAVISICLREAVTNIVRHAQAKTCTITLAQSENRIVLTVADDGRGGSGPEGFGLTGMRERIATVGGTLVRDGSRGMKLTITLPAPAVRSMERTA